MNNRYYLLIITLLMMPLNLNAQQPVIGSGISLDGNPGILLTKTRLILEGRKRGEQISISNNGSAAGLYKLTLLNKEMDAVGKVRNVEVDPQNDTTRQMIRLSPRRFTLQPGQSQKIRVLVRKPKGLDDGEYRTHLSIRTESAKLDDSTLADNLAEQENNGNIGLKLKPTFGITMPIIVRHGNTSAQATLSELNLSKNENKIDELNFEILRQGNQSLYGDIEVLGQHKNGKTYQMKYMGGVAVYTPLAKRKVRVLLDSPNEISLSKVENIIVQYIHRDSKEVISKAVLKL